MISTGDLRKGIVIERQPRLVHIFELRLIELKLPDVKFLLRCTKGTYVRTLCDDIGNVLGCGGHLAVLERTRIGEFRLESAPGLEEIQAAAESGDAGAFLVPMEALLPETPAFVLTEEGVARIRDGRRVEPSHLADPEAVFPPPDDIVRLLGGDGRLSALARLAPGESAFAPFLVLL